MIIHQLSKAPSPGLGAALERFERLFRYPLGRDATFRIAHGAGYVSFFSAIGETTLLVAERDGEVLGTLAGIRRPLRLPSGEVRTVTYLCDFKVSPAGSSGRTLLRLAQHMGACANDAGGGGGYSVVMDGTARTPADYTGRCGIPGFAKAGQIDVLRVSAPPRDAAPLQAKTASLEEVEKVMQELVAEEFLPFGGRPGRRSLMQPVALLAPDHRSCGVVEDTRRGKRLFMDSGEEMLSAHLSRFAYTTADAGACLLREALSVAADAGFPALFLALPRSRTDEMLRQLADLKVTVATASIYAHAVEGAQEWRIDSSEI